MHVDPRNFRHFLGNAEIALTQYASTTDGVILLDADGRVCYLNPAAERMVGISAGEVEGWPLHYFFTLYDGSSEDILGKLVPACRAGGRLVSLGNHALLLTRQGKFLPIAGSAQPLRTVDGRFNGVLVEFRDVTPTRMLMERISFGVPEESQKSHALSAWPVD